MTDHDPPRLSARSGTDVGRALDAARARSPREPDVARLAALIGVGAPVIAQPPAGPSTPPPVPVPVAAGGLLSSLFGKSIAVVSAGVVATAVALTATSTPTPTATPAAPAVSAPAAPEAPVAVVIVPEPAPAPAEPEAPSVPRARRARIDRVEPVATAPVETAPAPSAPEADGASRMGEEAELIARAERSLASAPATSLALANEHRGRFGDGIMQQEREVIAIDALLRLGRRGEAEARAVAFDRAHGASIHTRRIHRLLERTP